MHSSDLAALVARVSLAAPVLYVGLSMALDPSAFVASLQKLARFLQEQWLTNFQSRDLRLRPAEPPSTSVRTSLRFTGAWLIIGAVLHIAGLLT